MEIQAAIEILRKYELYVEQRQKGEVIRGADIEAESIKEMEEFGSIDIAEIKAIFQIEKIGKTWVGWSFCGQLSVNVGASPDLEKAVDAIINIFVISRKLNKNVSYLLCQAFELQNNNFIVDFETTEEIAIFPCLADRTATSNRHERMLNKSEFIDKRYKFILRQNDTWWTIDQSEFGESDKTITVENLEQAKVYILSQNLHG